MTNESEALDTAPCMCVLTAASESASLYIIIVQHTKCYVNVVVMVS